MVCLVPSPIAFSEQSSMSGTRKAAETYKDSGFSHVLKIFLGDDLRKITRQRIFSSTVASFPRMNLPFFLDSTARRSARTDEAFSRKETFLGQK